MLRHLMVIVGVTMWLVRGDWDDDRKCTSYAFTDLYILLDVYPTSAANFQRGFEFVENLVKIAQNFDQTRFSFWTGNTCDNRHIQGRLCSSTEDFRFNFFQDRYDEAVILSRLNQIKDQLTPQDSSKAQTANQLFSPREINGKLLKGIEWLGALKLTTRPIAELVLLVLTPGLHPVTEDRADRLQEIRTVMGNLARLTIKLHVAWSNDDPDWRSLDTAIFYDRIPSYVQQNITKLVSTVAGELNFLCIHVMLNCQFKINETIKEQTPCRFDSLGVCQRNLSDDAIRLERVANPGGKPCPDYVSILCYTNRSCIETCDLIDTQPWKNWSPCPCARKERSRIREPKQGHPAIRCPLTMIETCDCSAITQTNGESSWLTIVIVFIVTLTVLSTLTAILYFIRKKKKKEARGAEVTGYRSQSSPDVPARLKKFANKTPIFTIKKHIAMWNGHKPTTVMLRSPVPGRKKLIDEKLIKLTDNQKSVLSKISVLSFPAHIPGTVSSSLSLPPMQTTTED